MNRTRTGLLSVFLLASSIFASPLLAATEPEEVQQFVSAARSSLARFLVDPEMVWFKENLDQALAVLIVPKRVRAGLIVGGSGGVGVLVAKDLQTGDWGQPAFYNLGGASLGLQAGGDRSEVILLVRTQEALDAFLTSRFKLGAEASIAAGPVGAGTGEQVDEGIVAFVRSKGLYVGAALDGTMIRPAKERNAAYYGVEVTPVDILVRRSVSSDGAIGLRSDLLRAAGGATAVAQQ